MLRHMTLIRDNSVHKFDFLQVEIAPTGFLPFISFWGRVRYIVDRQSQFFLTWKSPLIQPTEKRYSVFSIGEICQSDPWIRCGQWIHVYGRVKEVCGDMLGSMETTSVLRSIILG